MCSQVCHNQSIPAWACLMTPGSGAVIMLTLAPSIQATHLGFSLVVYRNGTSSSVRLDIRQEYPSEHLINKNLPPSSTGSTTRSCPVPRLWVLFVPTGDMFYLYLYSVAKRMLALIDMSPDRNLSHMGMMNISVPQ